jgi:hypothetical protein
MASPADLGEPTTVPVASKIAGSSETQLRSVTTNTAGEGPATVKVTFAIQAQLLGPSLYNADRVDTQPESTV